MTHSLCKISFSNGIHIVFWPPSDGGLPKPHQHINQANSTRTQRYVGDISYIFRYLNESMSCD